MNKFLLLVHKKYIKEIYLIFVYKFFFALYRFLNLFIAEEF